MQTQPTNTQKTNLTPAQQTILAAAERKIATPQKYDDYYDADYADHHGDYYDAYEECPDNPDILPKNQETQAQKFKRILAVTGKVITGNLILAAMPFAITTPVFYLMGRHWGDAMTCGSILSGAFLGEVHTIMRLMADENWYTMLVGAEVYDRIADHISDIKNTIAERRHRHQVHGK